MFICFEGIDGAGKTTQARMLQQRLTENGYRAELVADPGTTKIGTAIRQILLENDGPITPAAQMLLFSAARAELSAYIGKCLKQKMIVVCDRWFLSTLVYQGVINNLPIHYLNSIFEMSQCRHPDLCFLLDIAPEEAKKRMGKPRDRYERKCLAARKTMRTAYLNFAKQDYAKTTHVIAATSAPDFTHEYVYNVVKAQLKRRTSRVTKRKESKV